MKIHQHYSAGILVIDDLPAISNFVIKDGQGHVKKIFPAITPSITIDIENWISGWYKFIVTTPTGKISLRVKVG
jgi:hypothetical protein